MQFSGMAAGWQCGPTVTFPEAQAVGASPRNEEAAGSPGGMLPGVIREVGRRESL